MRICRLGNDFELEAVKIVGVRETSQKSCLNGTSFLSMEYENNEDVCVMVGFNCKCLNRWN